MAGRLYESRLLAQAEALDLPKIRFDAFIRRLLLSRSEDGNEQKDKDDSHMRWKKKKRRRLTGK
ncbi:MAG TPA: hypothetical protein DCG39_00780 [Opitutae bacterium]|nr:hypothetical protein [Opitutae bacterium]